MAVALRPYQEEAITALSDYWLGGGGNALLDMATGVGKSVVIGEITRRLMMAGTSRRIVILTHVKELIEQDARALRMVWPDAPIGICSAGLGQRDTDAPVVIAGVQSVFRKPDALGARDLVLIDEAHLVPADGDGMYITTIAALRKLQPEMRVAGFTATPYRLDTGRLDEGDDRLFDRVVFSYGIGEAVQDGWLAPLVAKATRSEIDVRGVARRGGEFVPSALEEAANGADIVAAAVDEIVERGKCRRSWLAFCAGVAHAKHVRDVLQDRGMSAETVTGETPQRERDEIFTAFKAGDIRALTGANVFTTGFDAAAVDLIAMLRPTLSPGLYVQMLGRGTRKADGKANCEVLDFAGNVRRHGPVDTVTGPRARPADGGADQEPRGEVAITPVKACPDCNTYVIASARTCSQCGFEWPAPPPPHRAQSDTAPVMSGGDPVWHQVTAFSVCPHQKSGSDTPTLQVNYFCEGRYFRDWIALEHHGHARRFATRKWEHLGGALPAPATVAEALNRRRELARPRDIEIGVRFGGKYWTVVECRLRESEAAR